MDSFAFFYEGSNINETGIKCRFLKKFFKSKSKDINADLHFNVWTLEEKEAIIDIGMKINNTKGYVKNIFIYIPAKIKKSEIHDLSDKFFNNPKLANLIFNYDCEITKYTIEINNIKYKLLNINDIKEFVLTKEGCLLNLDINSYSEPIYIRFRIKSRILSKKLFYIDNKIHNILKFYQDVYNIVDFKVNNKRDFPYEEFILQKDNILFNFKKIHFLVMDYIYNSIKLLSKNNYHEVRTLEDGWEDYIDINKRILKRAVAYHFKSIINEHKDDGFSIVLKILKSRTTIFRYVISSLLIGVISGIISSIIIKHYYVSNIFTKILIFIILGLILIYFISRLKCFICRLFKIICGIFY